MWVRFLLVARRMRSWIGLGAAGGAGRRRKVPVKRSAILMLAGACIGLSAGACDLLDDPQQCATDGDCDRFGAVCDTAQALCVPRVAGEDSGAPFVGDAGLEASAVVSKQDAETRTPSSCYALHLEQPSVGDGIHEIDPDGPDAGPRRVYCNMTIDNGGWTLVARSAGDAGVPFGWQRPTGSVDDDAVPYSLGAVADLRFTQLLVTSHDGTKKPSGNAYRIEVPAGFATTYASSAFAVPVTATVLGSCSPESGVAMFSFVGFTAREDGFWFRDMNTFAAFGLDPRGWRLFFANDCNGAGLLDGKQGLIFVR